MTFNKKTPYARLVALTVALLLQLPAAASATDQDPAIFAPTANNIHSIKLDGSPVLSTDGTTLKVAFSNGGNYPGINFPLGGNVIDLSNSTGIQTEVTNIGTSRVKVILRVDNPGDWKQSPWNTENVWINPGETKTLKVIFGQSYGQSGYALNPAKISSIKLFSEKPKSDAAIQVTSLVPAGRATPKASAPTPANTTTTSTADQSSEIFIPTANNIHSIKLDGSPVLSMDSGSLKVAFSNGGNYPGINFLQPGNAIDLSSFTGIQTEITNLGSSRVKVILRVDNPGDWKKSPWNTENVVINPGETKTLKVIFGQSYGQPGYALNPARISSIKLFSEKPKTDAAIRVGSLVSAGSATPTASASTTTAATASTGVQGSKIFAPTTSNIHSIKLDGSPALSMDGDSLKVAFSNGGNYPGINFLQPGNVIDLSNFAGIQTEVTNVGTSRVKVILRVDNPGDWKQSPWNTENIWIEPGQTKTLKVTFGQSYGKPGYALNPAKISSIKLFSENPKSDAAIRVSSLVSAGSTSATSSTTAPVTTKPAANTGTDATYSPSIGGELIDIDLNGLTDFKFSHSAAIIEAGKIKATFEAGSNYPNVVFPIPAGGWNLSAFSEIQVTVTNPNEQKLLVYMRVDNPGNWQDEPWNTEKLLFNAGETKTLTLTFGKQNGAPAFPLNPARITAIQLFIIRPKTETTLLIADLKASGSPADAANELSFTHPDDRNTAAILPEWLGSRPPVDGDWELTLDENFDGEQLNESLWTTRFPWDGPQRGQKQRYAPQNVIVGNGVATFKVDKTFGHENNDPNLGTRDYTSGLIQSYDKWAQLYGYFEARIKVPYVRGLWPAYWMMPDRGAASGLNKWQRRNTTNGAMEIDIMEILSEWGPGRNSVATHWDGYGIEHKQWGTSQIYYGPTEDDFHVFGLLWEPGKLTWYVDGKKVAELINDNVSNAPSYLKFNVQMGGWATSDIDDANLPAAMEVDYTRAWQLKSRL